MSPQRNLNEIAQRIKQRRQELNLSLQDVASMTGMSKSTLQRYETGGIKNIPLQKLDSLSAALQTSSDWIMSGGEVWYKDLLELYRDLYSDGADIDFNISAPAIALEKLYGDKSVLPPHRDGYAVNKAYLTSDEVLLVYVYRFFTEEGQQKIKDYMVDLGENPKYFPSHS